MNSAEDIVADYQIFKSRIAAALDAISRSLEIMQANLFITRSIIDSIEDRDLVSIAEIRHRAERLASIAESNNIIISHVQQILQENETEMPRLVQ